MTASELYSLIKGKAQGAGNYASSKLQGAGDFISKHRRPIAGALGGAAVGGLGAGAASHLMYGDSEEENKKKRRNILLAMALGGVLGGGAGHYSGGGGGAAPEPQYLDSNSTYLDNIINQGGQINAKDALGQFKDPSADMNDYNAQQLFNQIQQDAGRPALMSL